VGSHSFQGAAYVFEKPAAGWASASETAKLTASDGAAGDSLGTSVAVSGDTVVAGAPFANGNTGYVSVFGPALAAITLTPAAASSPVGTSHTLTATITQGGSPLVGRAVTFSVDSGPDAGLSGTGLTDANGQTSFTYTNNGTAGTDAISASFVNDQGIVQ